MRNLEKESDPRYQRYLGPEFDDNDYASVLAVGTGAFTRREIKELDIRFRAIGRSLFRDDILGLAENASSAGIPIYEPEGFIDTISRQWRKFEGKKIQWPVHLKIIKYLSSNGMDKVKFEPPYLVAHTCNAIFKYHLPEKEIDPSVFLTNSVCHLPQGVDSGVISDCFIEDAFFVGSALLEFTDTQNVRYVFLRQRRGSTCPGQWSIPGGHGIGLGDVAGLRELKEETGVNVDVLEQARPLAIVDQLLPISENGQIIDWKRFLNLVWRVSVDEKTISQNWPRDNDHEGEWTAVSQENVLKLDKANLLTPIAYHALWFAGYFR